MRRIIKIVVKRYDHGIVVLFGHPGCITIFLSDCVYTAQAHEEGKMLLGSYKVLEQRKN